MKNLGLLRVMNITGHYLSMTVRIVGLYKVQITADAPIKPEGYSWWMVIVNPCHVRQFSVSVGPGSGSVPPSAFGSYLCRGHRPLYATHIYILIMILLYP